MEGAEHLLRRAEAGHQVFKVAGIEEGQLEAPRDQALGDAGRAQQKHALAAQGRQQTEPQGILALVEPPRRGPTAGVAGAREWGRDEDSVMLKVA